jgi:hypothetical protein
MDTIETTPCLLKSDAAYYRVVGEVALHKLPDSDTAEQLATFIAEVIAQNGAPVDVFYGTKSWRVHPLRN